MHPTHLLWHAAGQPAYPQTDSGACRICGESSAGLSFDAWVRDTFTNHDALRPGAVICHVCQFAFAQDSALLAERTGKDKPQRMQNYSHIVADGVCPRSHAQHGQSQSGAPRRLRPTALRGRRGSSLRLPQIVPNPDNPVSLRNYA